MATHLAYINNFADVIQVIQGDIRAVSLPEKADLIVSEWMGSIGVDENMLGPVLWARDHFLKPDGVLVPRVVTALAAPIATALRPDVGFFLNRPYGLDLAPLAEPSVHELLNVRRPIHPDDLAAAPQVLWRTDVTSDPPSVVRQPYSAHLKFTMLKDARVSGLGAWFAAELAPGVSLSNAPDAPDTHWGQLMLPLEGQLELRAGDVLEMKVTARSVGPGPLQLGWSARVNDERWQNHDTMGAAPMEPPPATQEPPRSALSRFLASLAVDPELLGKFLADPDALMARHGLSDAHRAALKTLNPMQIQEALYESKPAT
jgi:hypothetical protein